MADTPEHRAAQYLGRTIADHVKAGSWYPVAWPTDVDAADTMAETILGYDASVRVMSLANRYARLLLGTPDADDRVNGTKDWRERQSTLAGIMRDHAAGIITTDQAIERHKALNR